VASPGPSGAAGRGAPESVAAQETASVTAPKLAACVRARREFCAYHRLEETMDRRTAVAFATVLVGSGLVLGSSALAQQKSVKDQLVGSWDNSRADKPLA
jgi:hypothetical protein